ATSERFPVSGSRLPSRGGGVEAGRLIVGEVDVAVADLVSADPIHLVNLATASALALRLGGTPSGIGKAARVFAPGGHRRTMVTVSGDVTWIDDSKATNPHAAIASIRSHESVILIAGGLAKGLDLRPLAEEPNLRAVIGIGAEGPVLVEAAGSRGYLAGTLDRAVELAATLAEPGDTVLLAPGCASFDQFKSYAERGDQFASLVREKTGGGSAG
ncbi:MAG TPA: cyanophycin synthetase, partial [Acidimicrobiia bacterium]|nr:cyanophycin synthetase [Acidimicrobiia bacterium]